MSFETQTSLGKKKAALVLDSSFTMSPRNTARPVYFWRLGSNSANRDDTKVHHCSRKWTFFESPCSSRITSFLFFTFSSCHAGIISSFCQSLSTAASAFVTSIACGCGINLWSKLYFVIEFYPLPSMDMILSVVSWTREPPRHMDALSFESFFFFFGFTSLRFNVVKNWSASLYLSCTALPHRLEVPTFSSQYWAFLNTSPSYESMKWMPLNLRALSSFGFSFAHSCSSLFWAAFPILVQTSSHTFSSLVVAWILSVSLKTT